MDHEIAVKSYAIERYILGEMQPEERDAFEDHYFSCEICAEEIHLTSVFVDNAKVVLKSEKRGEVALPSPSARPSARPSFSWSNPWLGVPAFAALIAMGTTIGYQNLVQIPALKAPTSIAVALPLDGVTRGGVPQLPQGKPLRFRMALSPYQGEWLYTELRNEAGKLLRAGVVESASADQGLAVYFPGVLKPGRYVVVVRAWNAGQPGQELSRNRFDIVSQEPSQ